MRRGRVKRLVTKGIAWVMSASMLFPVVGEHVSAWTITVHAAEGSTVENCVLSLGSNHSAVIKSDGSLWMWGENKYGKLGDGTTEDRSVPIKIMEDVKSVSLGTNHSATIKVDGSLWMWGDSSYGQVFGDGSINNNSDIPIKVMENVKSVSLGANGSAVIKDDGSLWIWGQVDYGLIGTMYPEPIKIMDDVIAVSLGSDNSAAIKSDRSLWMWGSNCHGELGDGTTEGSYIPKKIMDDVVTFSVDSHSGCAAIKSDGSLWMWGKNDHGQLGDGTTEDSYRPKKIMDNVVDVSSGMYYSAAIKDDGSLWTWGYNSGGLLGNGSTNDSSTPIKIMDDVKFVSLGSIHSAAVKDDGSLWMWGNNYYGQLGNGTNRNNSTVPVEIMPAGSIDVSGTGGSTSGNTGGSVTFPVYVEPISAHKIQVLDSGNKPIEGATVMHNGQFRTTSVDGTVELANYKKGAALTISKEGYADRKVEPFIKSNTGCNTFILFKSSESERADAIESVIMTDDASGTGIDVLTTEATINRYYTDTKFSLRCTGYNASSFSLYSGSKLVAKSNNGIFTNLVSGDFTAGQPVWLQPESADLKGSSTKIKLGIQVINQDISVPEFAIGEAFKIDIPDSVPIVGGKTLEMELGDSPVEISWDTNGEIKIGINAEELAKKDKDWFSTLKKLNKDNARKYIEEVKNEKDKPKKPAKPEIDVIGYLEGNVKNMDHLTGRVFVELSWKDSWENQYEIAFVPVVVEVSVSGKINADGSLTYTLDKGYSGTLSVGGEVGLGLYGGVGFAKILSGGIYGDAAFGLAYDILPESVRGLNQLYVAGAAGIEGKILGSSHKLELISGTYYIINKQNGNRATLAYSVDGNTIFAIDNDKAYPLFERSYLSANGGAKMQWMSDAQVSADGSVQETELQGAAYPDIIPTVVRAGNTVMLFYLTDAGAGRADADRSMLVYSVWNDGNENWSEPVAVLDDGTADFTPDIYSDGSKVYAVWQNADESLAGGLTLNETADRLTLHAAVYDPEEAEFTNLGAIESGNGLFQQQPQIVSDGESVSVYWYENGEDNVLGLSGTNRIYRAVLSDVNAVSGTGVMSVPMEEDEETEEGSDTGDTENTEDSEDPGTDEEEPADDEDSDNDEEDSGSDNEDEENSDTGESNAEDSDVEEEAEDSEVTSKENDNPDAGDADTEDADPKDENRVQAVPVGTYTYSSAFSKYVAEGEEDEALTEGGKTDYVEDKKGSKEEEIAPEDGEDEGGEAEPKEEETTPEEGEGDPDGSEDKDNEAASGEETDPDDELTESEEAYSSDETLAGTYDAGAEAVQVMADAAENPWKVSLLHEEKNCIVSADAGVKDGKASYAYVAGGLDGMLQLTDGRVLLLSDGTEGKTLDTGICGHVEFTTLYGEEALAWYKDGDIRYVNGDGSIKELFGESRLLGAVYTLLSDDDSVEILFPVNMGGRSNLYRITSEGGEFGAALAVTDQEDYIQYADGFIDGDRTIMVYNRMEAEVLESNNGVEINEKNNGLYTGTLNHAYYDIAIRSAGSMVREDEEIGEDVLEITAQIYNNGTIEAEQLNLSLAKADGTVLETVTIDTVLESGETGYATAVFSLDNITEEGEYTVTVSGSTEFNTDNNSIALSLGGAEFEVNAGVVAVADTRTVQIGIKNTGITSCGGTVSLREVETGEEYCTETFEPIQRGTTVYVEVDVDNRIFDRTDTLGLEAVVAPDSGTQESVSSYVTVYAPTYTVDFVTRTGGGADEGTHTETVFVSYGKRAEFPANPTKEGAYFIGWYTTEDPAAGTLYTEETPVREDVNLYACFATEQGSIPLEKCSVSEIPIQLYTGKALKPAVTVKWGSEVLSPKTDYTVSYENNKEQGRATVTITGKGNYTGTISRTFMILYPLNKVTVKAFPAVDFTGEYHMPEVTATYNNQTLKKGKDYTVTYTNNRNAGTAGVTLTGIGTYSGTKTVTFNIKGLSITKDIVFEKPEDVVYSGGKQTPIITVKTKAGEQLQAGSDYKVAYENAVNKGTATATVIGNGNFTGTKKFTYKILARPLTADMIAEITPQAYTGSAIKPEVIVIDESTSPEPLVQGRDYTVSYSKNKAAGTATVTVKGKGNYSGTVRTSFEIVKVDLKELNDNGQLTVKVNDMAYTGRALKPSVQVYEGTKKLPGSAYAVAYSNNVGTDDGRSTGTVTVTGKGNYTGTVTADFRIVDKAKLVTSLKIDKIADIVYTGSAIEPDVTVMDGTYQLIQGQDYETSYSSQYNAGKATVTVKGIGSYAGSKDVTYKITKRAIADRNVLSADITIEPVADMKYTGYALKPDVVIKDKGEVLTLGKDYKLSYKNNTKISTDDSKAKITVTGMGNYSGSISTTTFNIVSWDYDSLWAKTTDQVYTGKALKPQVTFYTGEEEIALRSGTAVKISYADNKNAGTATVTITGKGELKDIEPFKVTFAIEPASLEDAVVSRVANQTLKGVAVKPIPKVKVGKNTLKADQDFTVKYLRNGVKGEAEMIITGIGNYTGECRKTFIVQ